MWPFDDIGGVMGAQLKQLGMSLFEAAMQGLWEASLAILRESFKLADQFSMFTVDTRTGPVSVLWPMMLWISGVLALGLFFWQMTVTSVRGGRGFLRLTVGPLQYGIALAVTVGMVAGFLAAADGLTQGILEYGLQSRNFQDALTHTTFVDGAVDGVKAVVLGICALFGVIPAGLGFVLEMLFREAAIYVLVATIPITAAGLLAQVTMTWFWIAVRWILVCIAMKPVLALALVLGVAIAGGSQGLSGLLAGVGVLVISLLVPFVLFRLFAFVDPNSHPQGAFRDALSMAGVDSYGSNSPAMKAASAVSAFYGGGGDGGDAQESANTGRFDDAANQGESPDAGLKSTPHTANPHSDSDDANGSGGPSGGGSGGYGGPEGSGGPSTPPPDPSTDGDTDTDSEAEGGTGGSGRSRGSAANRGRAMASDGLGPQMAGSTGGSDDAAFDDGADCASDGAGGSTDGEAPTPDVGSEPAAAGESGSGARTGVVPPSTSAAATGAEDEQETSPIGDAGAASGPGEGSGGDDPLPPEAPDASGQSPGSSDHATAAGGTDAVVPPPPSTGGAAGGGDTGSEAPPGPNGPNGADGGGAGGEVTAPPVAPDSPDPGPGPAAVDDDVPRGGAPRGRRHGRKNSSDDDDPGDDGAEGVVPV